MAVLLKETCTTLSWIKDVENLSRITLNSQKRPFKDETFILCYQVGVNVGKMPRWMLQQQLVEQFSQ